MNKNQQGIVLVKGLIIIAVLLGVLRVTLLIKTSRALQLNSTVPINPRVTFTSERSQSVTTAFVTNYMVKSLLHMPARS